MVEADFAE